MFFEIPDDIAAKVVQEARRSGQPPLEVLVGILRRAFGLAPAEDPLRPQDDNSEDTLSEPSKGMDRTLEQRVLTAFDRSGDPAMDSWSEVEVMAFAVREVRAVRAKAPRARTG